MLNRYLSHVLICRYIRVVVLAKTCDGRSLAPSSDRRGGVWSQIEEMNEADILREWWMNQESWHHPASPHLFGAFIFVCLVQIPKRLGLYPYFSASKTVKGDFLQRTYTFDFLTPSISLIRWQNSCLSPAQSSFPTSFCVPNASLYQVKEGSSAQPLWLQWQEMVHGSNPHQQQSIPPRGERQWEKWPTTTVL